MEKETQNSFILKPHNGDKGILFRA